MENSPADFIGNQIIDLVSTWMKHPNKAKNLTTDLQVLVRGMLWHTRLTLTFQKGEILNDGAYEVFMDKRKKSRKTRMSKV